MQSYLILSSDEIFINNQIELLKKSYKSESFNIHEVNTSLSVGIDDIRKITALTASKPYGGGGRLIIIRNVEKATPEAANSLLKLLEEPPDDTAIILTSANGNRILPTVTSRCQIITRTDKESGITGNNQVTLNIIRSILKSSPGERILLAQNSVKTKEESLTLLQSMLVTLDGILGNKTDETGLSLAEISLLLSKISAAKNYIERNVSYKAVLDILFLGFPKLK